MFRTEDQTRKTSDEKVHYYAPSRVSKLVNLMITSVIFVLLAAPVLGMYHLSTLKTSKAMLAAIGVLMIFTILFAAAMSLLTKARRHELFAATAAYCAVLVVFIGSTNFN
jgi:branched-subunit amino acid transport protein AzlD